MSKFTDLKTALYIFAVTHYENYRLSYMKKSLGSASIHIRNIISTLKNTSTDESPQAESNFIENIEKTIALAIGMLAQAKNTELKKSAGQDSFIINNTFGMDMMNIIAFSDWKQLPSKEKTYSMIALDHKDDANIAKLKLFKKGILVLIDVYNMRQGVNAYKEGLSSNEQKDRNDAQRTHKVIKPILIQLTKLSQEASDTTAENFFAKAGKIINKLTQCYPIMTEISYFLGLAEAQSPKSLLNAIIKIISPTAPAQDEIMDIIQNARESFKNYEAVITPLDSNDGAARSTCTSFTNRTNVTCATYAHEINPSSRPLEHPLNKILSYSTSLESVLSVNAFSIIEKLNELVSFARQAPPKIKEDIDKVVKHLNNHILGNALFVTFVEKDFVDKKSPVSMKELLMAQLKLAAPYKLNQLADDKYRIALLDYLTSDKDDEPKLKSSVSCDEYHKKATLIVRNLMVGYSLLKDEDSAKDMGTNCSRILHILKQQQRQSQSASVNTPIKIKGTSTISRPLPSRNEAEKLNRNQLSALFNRQIQITSPASSMSNANAASSALASQQEKDASAASASSTLTSTVLSQLPLQHVTPRSRSRSFTFNNNPLYSVNECNEEEQKSNENCSNPAVR